MLVLLVVLAVLMIGAVAVVVLDRAGVLSGAGSGPGRSGGGSFLERMPRAGLLTGMAVMAAWILAWLVLLVIGLSVLAS